MSKSKIFGFAVLFALVAGGALIYAQLNWYGRALIHSTVWFETWPLEWGIRRHFLQHRNDFEIVVQRFRSDPSLQSVYVLDSELCVEKLNESPCEVVDDDFLKETLRRTAMGHAFRISENRGVLFSAGDHFKDGRDISIAITNRFNDRSQLPVCSNRDPSSAFGGCELVLGDAWSIHYEWMSRDYSKIGSE